MKNVILTKSPSAGGAVRQLFRKIRPDWQTRVFATTDDYSHGPLPTHGASCDFFLERQAFWKSLESYNMDAVYQFDLSDEYTALVKEIQIAEHAKIWFTNTVQEVFYVVVLLHLLRLGGIETSDVLIRDLSGSQVRWGLGSVRAEELEAMYKSSEAVPIDTKLFSDAWNAISHGTGEAISRFIGELDASTPMAKALSAYLLRFPEFNSGLGSIERALLGSGTTEMKKSAFTVGTAMTLGGSESDVIGDWILFSRLVELSNVTVDPWFEIEGDPHHMRSCSAQITESGKEARVRYSVQVLGL
ncbi:DUF1835 domain-containing protein [Aliiroseovarius sp. KMU-50]|uniref:DUF1835 domain-containing protein n=1 Tax=Aliiroseovarius salicola TaxID=3009082 RepID=A0ABT4W0R4_9RHOB|nr:DUF1835 domain-containing protein [Aliiroseovarius sp. KMU-50]MDA5094009.1 DUF1835 domain-containing protein [Aliiroseovarius sp. KMU-50]